MPREEHATQCSSPSVCWAPLSRSTDQISEACPGISRSLVEVKVVVVDSTVSLFTEIHDLEYLTPRRRNIE
jgi:hypothetical protein